MPDRLAARFGEDPIRLPVDERDQRPMGVFLLHGPARQRYGHNDVIMRLLAPLAGRVCLLTVMAGGADPHLEVEHLRGQHLAERLALGDLLPLRVEQHLQHTLMVTFRDVVPAAVAHRAFPIRVLSYLSPEEWL